MGLHCLPMSILWNVGHKWVKKVRLYDASSYMQKKNAIFIFILKKALQNVCQQEVVLYFDSDFDYYEHKRFLPVNCFQATF